MEVGTKLDPLALSYIAADVKGLLLEAGYVMPQGSVAKLPMLPLEVQAKIKDIQILQEQYQTTGEAKAFQCPYCQTNNSAEWKKEVSTGIEFLTCGSCVKVVEVK